MERLTRFLLSRRSIVGSALAVGGLLLHLVGLLGGPLWLPIVVGLYLVGVLLVPGERGLDLALDAAADGEEVRRGLERLVRSLRGKVAPDIIERVEHIRDSILVTLEAEQDRVAGDPNARLIRQTALDYLPTALTAYLALPRAQAERRPVAGGRTPHSVLLEQLDLMDTKMREAADAVLAHDSERLLANGRFLADRFGVSSLHLGDPAGVPEAVTAPAAEAVRAVPEPVPETADERERVR
ncbi:MAG TPA: hypothetical protein VES19_14560 [Candidatus Limnocylindrales bacterium]|nr:hypothetical protein [Candidatus Limnocylindrales bacterium]